VKAAGRPLTVGELREAIAGLDDNAPVTALGDCQPILAARTESDGLILDVLDQEGIAEVVEWVIGVADGDFRGPGALDALCEAAEQLLVRTGIAPE
jgi:hypothetical protein